MGKRNILKDIGTILTIATICMTFVTIVSAALNSQEDKLPDTAPLQNAIKKAIADGNFSADDIRFSRI